MGIRRFTTNKLFYSTISVVANKGQPSVGAGWVPARLYENADKSKLQIIKENKGKAGIYL